MHRSGGAGECVEEDDGDGGEEKGCDDHQIGEGARRHIRVASASASASASGTRVVGLERAEEEALVGGFDLRSGWKYGMVD